MRGAGKAYRGGGGGVAPSAKRVAKDVKEHPLGVFYAQLQMIRGISAEKALRIVAKYPSAASLLRAYADPCLTTEERRDLLADVISPGRKERALSARVYDYYACEDPHAIVQ